MSNERGVRRLLIVPLALVLLAGPANADSVSAPMYASGGRQDGALLWSTEVSSVGGGLCLVVDSDGTGKDPAPVAHDGAPLTWRLDDPRRPDFVGLWRAPLGVDGTEVLEPTRQPVTLDPIKRRGEVVGWRIRSEAVGYGDVRLVLSIQWPEEACGHDKAAYRYRALSLPGLPG